VGNIPKVYSEEHLIPVFGACGRIVELVMQVATASGKAAATPAGLLR
jgi:hypothetical protein